MSISLNLSESELLDLDATFVSAAEALTAAEAALIDAQATVDLVRVQRDTSLDLLERYETERKQLRSEGVGLGVLLAALAYALVVGVGL
jgi:hypothetical protein